LFQKNLHQRQVDFVNFLAEVMPVMMYNPLTVHIQYSLEPELLASRRLTEWISDKGWKVRVWRNY